IEDAMKVVRTELYDFTIVLSEKEFKRIAAIATKLELSMEQAFAEIVGMGITDFDNIKVGKESKDVVDRQGKGMGRG
ncbi:unnamed protein product, partial [marine sediment metagenome]